MTLHTSGVVHNNKAVLFSVEAGGGKSTLAALLHTHGYQLLFDDLLTADQKAYVYSSPSAISVKDETVDVLINYYPELKDRPIKMASNGKYARYLSNTNKKKEKHGYEVRAIIFLKFISRKAAFLEPICKKKSIQLLLKEVWVNPEPTHIAKFPDWIDKATFYKMQYSKTFEALEYISKIFDE